MAQATFIGRIERGFDHLFGGRAQRSLLK